jgi:hypothetical protein
MNSGSHRAGAPPRGAPRGNRTFPPRKRKCRNWPDCGDGEHYDAECKFKGPAVDTKQRAYYILPEEADELDNDDIDIDPLLFEVLDKHPTLEHDYELGQNAYFASKLRSANVFFASQRAADHNRPPRMTTPKPSECRACHEAFPSRSRLHAHLLASGHNRLASKAHFTVIKSKHVTSDDHEARLASYHYAEARFVLHPGSTESRVCCMDSGYGNSAVDAGFIAQYIAHPT